MSSSDRSQCLTRLATLSDKLQALTDSNTVCDSMTYMPCAWSGLLDARWLFAYIGPMLYLGSKAASPVIVPPHFDTRAG